MKKLQNLFFVAIALTLTLSACYEEGPKISFRMKRDRLANEWVVTDYTIDGSTSDSSKKSFYIGDSIAYIFSIQRENKYSLNMGYTKEYSDNNNGKVFNLGNNMGNRLYIDLIAGIQAKNILFKKVNSGGEWSFKDKFRQVSFGFMGNRDLSLPDGQEPFTADVIMLNNKKLKLGFSDNGKNHVITFEPRNPEIVKN